MRQPRQARRRCERDSDAWTWKVSPVLRAGLSGPYTEYNEHGSSILPRDDVTLCCGCVTSVRDNRARIDKAEAVHAVTTKITKIENSRCELRDGRLGHDRVRLAQELR